MTRHLLAGLILLFGIAAQAAGQTEVYQVGDRLDPITLQDQHGQAHTLDSGARLLLFTTGMKGGGVIREVLDHEPQDYLSSRNALFISNISGMPKLIAKTIALPSMRSHKYPIVLDRDGETTRRIPAQDNSATLIRLQDLRIESIEFTRSAADVRAAVAALPATPAQ